MPRKHSAIPPRCSGDRPPRVDPADPETMPVDELRLRITEILGRQVSLTALYCWIRAGLYAADGHRVRLPSTRIGGRVLSSLAAYRWWTDRLCRLPEDDTTDHPQAARRAEPAATL